MPASGMQANFQIGPMQAFFRGGASRPAAFRKEQLRRLEHLIEAHLGEIHRALHDDLGKPETEAFLSETGYVLRDLRAAQRHLERWMRPVRHRMPAGLQPASARVIPEPKGAVLIIGPWNYPFQLLLSPLAAAIAAGNCAVLKPSECTPRVSALLARLIGDAFPPEYLRVVEGGRDAAEALLAQPFDHVFFTGGTEAGRSVAQAAAGRLIPVTLELGGKCPALVFADTDLKVAARRIARGKFMNAGQTCVAPDHVRVARPVYETLVWELREALHAFYGPDPRHSPDYGRIVNRHHFDRVRALMQGGEIVCGGDTDERTLYIAPTVIQNPPAGSPLLTEEIFGPVLPVIPFDSEEEIVAWYQAQPTPLALYVFTSDRARRRRLIETIPSGGVCINDTVSQVIPYNLPFGGKGASGTGRYHGRAGFDEFSHVRSILTRSVRWDVPAAYPPMKTPLKTLRRFYRFFAGG